MSLADAKPFATVAYPLDEASGSAIDAVGSLDLTDNNTVGAGTGLIDGARDFERNNNEFFSHADDAAFSVGDIDWTVCFYFNAESLAAGPSLISKWAGGGQLGYLLRTMNPGSGIAFQLLVSSDGSSTNNVIASTFGTLSTATWYSVVCVHDAAANEIRIYVNGVKDSASHSGGIFDNTADLIIGGHEGGDRSDGLMDELVFVKGYAFTDADATEHHNGGAGVAFADWDAGGGVTVPVLDEGMLVGGLHNMSGGLA